MHDGAPANCIRAVRDALGNTYHNRWIGRGGLNAWPPHSPDFNHLVLYLWERLNTLVYAAPADMKRHVALWMPVRLSATTRAFFNGRSGT
jgi:hypothetical protein